MGAGRIDTSLLATGLTDCCGVVAVETIFLVDVDAPVLSAKILDMEKYDPTTGYIAPLSLSDICIPSVVMVSVCEFRS